MRFLTDIKKARRQIGKDILLTLFVCFSVFGMASCENLRNIDADKIKNSAEHVFAEVCAEKNLTLRTELLTKLQEKWPQYPIYDICGLIKHAPD